MIIPYLVPFLIHEILQAAALMFSQQFFFLYFY
jgi:hypothetical protein